MKRMLKSICAVGKVHHSAFLVIFIFSFLSLKAQNQANVWYFGSKSGLDFTGTGAPTILNDGPNMSGATGEGEGCTTISDQNGNLLFFSDGDNIWDVNRAVMPNGTGLSGSFTSTQSALIIAQPGSVLTAGGYPRYYYIFTIDAVTGGGAGLRYSVVDMNLPGNGTVLAPRGDVVAASKNTAVQAGVVEAMVAIPHFNGTDTWILTRGLGTTNSYYSIPVTSGGVGTPVSSTAGIIPQGTSTTIIKSNPCYNMIALTYHSNWNTTLGASDNCFEILRYDNSTGIVSAFATNLKITNVIQLANSSDYRGIYGIEWSPNGRYLFISELVDKQLYQYDVYAGGTYPGTVGTLAGITASKVTLGTGSATRTGHVQLGPNGRIYTAQHVWASGISYVGEIANPNTYPATWNSTAYSWSFSSNSAFVCMGLPTLPKSFTAGKVTINDLYTACTNTAVPLSYFYLGAGVTSQTWSSATGTFTPSTTDAAPSVSYATTGTKTITLSVVDATCGYTRTDSKTITIAPTVTSAGTITCGTPKEGDVTSPGAYNYGWFSDAAGLSQIGSGTTNVSLPTLSGTTGTVYLKATSSTGATVTNLTNGPAINPNDGLSASSTLDFTVNTSQLTFGGFSWRTKDCSYSAANVFQNATISITHVGSSTVVYSRTQSVLVSDPSNSAGVVYTEAVNQILTPGTYRISITGTAGINAVAGWNGCASNTNDAQSALTYNTSGSNCFATKFTYNIRTETPCATMAAVPYNCPLPVTWLNFSGEKFEGGNLLTWSTASESNASHFEVERSLDGVNFEYVGSVSAHGTTSDVSVYSFVDPFFSTSSVYYRLKQADINAAFEYSKTIAISNTNGTYSLQPNPGDGLVYLVGASSEALISVLDLHGRTVLSDVVNEGKIDLTTAAKGVYLIQVIEANEVQTLRYVKQQ